MSNNEMKREIRRYMEKLEYMHPLAGTDKFIENSFEKWACKELLKEFDAEKDLPFRLTVIEILTAFSEKMKNYASKNQRNSLMFRIAEGTVEYFIEEYWVHGRN